MYKGNDEISVKDCLSW